MPRLRLTYTFQGENFGWSESYYSTFNLIANVAGAETTLRNARRGILSNQCRITHVRISDEEVFRDVFIKDLSADDGEGTQIAAAAMPNLGVLVQYASGVTVVKKFIRGIPDTLSANVGRYVPNPAWAFAFGLYSGTLAAAAQGWAILTMDTTQPLLAVTGEADAVAGVTAQITVGAGHGLVSGDRVRISGGFGTNIVKGVFAVTVLDGTRFTVPWTKTPIVYAGGAKMQKRLQTLKLIDKVEPMRIITRRAGRPFGSPVGRRRAS